MRLMKVKQLKTSVAITSKKHSRIYSAVLRNHLKKTGKNKETGCVNKTLNSMIWMKKKLINY